MDGWMDGEVLIRYLDKWMTIRNSLELGLWGRARWGGLGRVEFIEPLTRPVKLTRICSAWSIFLIFWTILAPKRLHF